MRTAFLQVARRFSATAGKGAGPAAPVDPLKNVVGKR